MLMKAVDAALEEALGSSAAKALKFYVDTSQVARDPLGFSMQLRKIFSGSEEGAKLIEEKISISLVRIMAQFSKPVNVPKIDKSSADIGSFESFINQCRSQFLIS